MTLPQSEKPVLAPVSPDLVWFTGTDAVKFLNDMVSREIADMTDGETRRSLLLGPQGKFGFMLWIVARGSDRGLITEQGRGGELAAFLGRFRIRVEVDITVETLPVWLVLGEWDGYDVSWPGVERHVVVGERPDLDVAGVADYLRLRIDAGEPEWGVDADETTIPHETGLVPVTVDFDKGCYLGQELVTRIESRGSNVPHRLRRIEGESGLIAGTTMLRDGKEVGKVTSVSGNVGLGMVHRSVDPETHVDVGGVLALVRELPPRTRD